jgi:hypothetical protein
MKFKDLSKQILKKTKEGKEITAYDWPSDIILEKDIVNKAKDLSSFTNKEGFFPKKSGAVGWEYGFSTLFLIDEIYISKSISGNYQSVSMGHSFSFKPVYSEDNSKLKFEILLDDKKHISKSYETKTLSNDSVIYGLSASFHTHPKFYHQTGQAQYTFFSGQDITSLLYGRTPILGLIAGSKIWLACKTSISRMISGEHLAQASRIELEQGNDAVTKYIKENMKEYGIVFYYGSLGGGLQKL